MSAPSVSVVVTCFNLGAYLPEALASVRGQTFEDYEIIVVDDGSSDDQTLAVLESLEPAIRVIRTANRGLSAARNTGVAASSGKYLCILDADDVLVPAMLERSVAYLEAHPDVAFVSHWFETFGDETWEWTPQRCDFPTLLDANTVNGAALVRREAVDAAGGWDETFRDGCEDWDFWITLVERGFTGAILPEVLFRYRRRRDSMSRVKFADGGLARLYRRIAEKHTATFRSYAEHLLSRRGSDIVANRAAADGAVERLELTILPALAKARDDAAEAERLVRRQNPQAELERQLTNLTAEAGNLRRQLAAAAEAWDQADRHQKIRAYADLENAALRNSWSWRITGPLRWVAALALRRPSRGA